MLSLLAIARSASPTWAQDQGAAALVTPLSGATLSGIVVITGTASHPQFQRYELAFGYDPNLTNTWFSIQDPVTLPVVGEVLGRWNTTGIADGVYIVRLRVYATDQGYVEAFVPGVRVQNTVATATLVPTPEMAPPTETPLPVGPTPTAAALAAQGAVATRAASSSSGTFLSQITATANPALLREAFLTGVKATLVVFGLIGIYAGLSTLWRARLRR
jgi:hypothetical protein